MVLPLKVPTSSYVKHPDFTADFILLYFQVVRKSQNGAARRWHPQPPAVVQAGTGPPRARGGARQDDPLPQTGPRYGLFIV